jgi:hypothetical protein
VKIFIIFVFSSIEEQMREMTFDDETGDYSSVGNCHSVDSKKFNNKLSINSDPSEYAEISENGNVTYTVQRDGENAMPEYAEVDKSQKINPPYATVDLQKKREERLKRQEAEKNLLVQGAIYEDIGNAEKPSSLERENNIYELVSSPDESAVEYSEVQDKYNDDLSIYAEPHIC